MFFTLFVFFTCTLKDNGCGYVAPPPVMVTSGYENAYACVTAGRAIQRLYGKTNGQLPRGNGHAWVPQAVCTMSGRIIELNFADWPAHDFSE